MAARRAARASQIGAPIGWTGWRCTGLLVSLPTNRTNSKVLNVALRASRQSMSGGDGIPSSPWKPRLLITTLGTGRSSLGSPRFL